MDKKLLGFLEIGHLTGIQILHGQNPKVLDDFTFQGDTPLHIAAREDYKGIVEWILQVKPTLAGARNKDKNMPLHEAAKYANPDIVKVLLECKKSSASYSNRFGETPLIIASKYGRVETVKLLLEAYGAYIDATERHRCFMLAAYKAYPGVAKAILNNPIKPSLFHCLLRVLFEWDILADVAKAILHNRMESFKSFFEIIFAREKMDAAVHGGHLEIVKAVLNSPTWNKDLMTKKDEFGRCPIHVAAMKGLRDIINEFMDKWSDCVEIRSSDHKSVLHFAVEYNQLAMVRSLLVNKWHEKVAELVSRDHDLSYNTALHLAAKNGVDSQLVEYLVSFPDVDVNALNNENMSALDIASAAAPHNPNCAIIVQILERAGAMKRKYKKGIDKDTANTHMLVASLIATVTFAAMFQIPGGIEDDKQSINYGAAKMAFSKLFRLFLVSDAMAFSSSLVVVLVWLLREQISTTESGGRSWACFVCGVSLPVSIMWTMVAFVSATIIVIKPHNFGALKSKDKKTFSKYGSLLQGPLYVISTPAFLVSFLSILWVWKRRFLPNSGASEKAGFVVHVFIQLCITTAYIIFYVLT